MRTIVSAGALALVAIGTPVAHPLGHVTVPSDLEWRDAGRGVERTVFEVSGPGEAWRTHIVAVRIDPSDLRFRLDGRLRGAGPGWTVERAPADAVLAVNVGQFAGITPWGWVVSRREEIRPPGTGPLSTAIVWDSDGRVEWLSPDEIPARRGKADVVEAIQSYPTLIDGNGAIPLPIRRRGLGVDVDHRDGRLAIGVLADGRLLVVLTRFYGLGPLSPPIPIGLTLDEMARVMRDLGCRRAVSLDGGISAQLLLRERGHTRIWRGWRPVPLGLVAERGP